MRFKKRLLSGLMLLCLSSSFIVNAEAVNCSTDKCIKQEEKSIAHDIKFYKEKIEKLLTEDTKKAIEEFNSKPEKDVVYTSFDGDDMNHMLEICKRALDDNKIPLNPEMALRYYISTNTLGGNKIAVMTDCLTLTLFADKLWVYGNNNRLLSEGIMAEIYLWNLIKNEGSTFIPDTYSSKKIHLNSKETFDYLKDKMENKFKDEISKNLLNKYSGSEHKTVYIGANFVNFKHIDWARIYAYQKGICPISPQNILSYYLYKNFKSEKEYLKDRLTLLKKSDKYWLCLDENNFEKEINRLDQNTLAELYVLNNFYPEKEVEVVDWGKIGVPKYNKSKKWALTTKEQDEIVNGISNLKNNA